MWGFSLFLSFFRVTWKAKLFYSVSSTALVRLAISEILRCLKDFIAQKHWIFFCPIGPHKRSKYGNRHEQIGEIVITWTLESPGGIVEKEKSKPGTFTSQWSGSQSVSNFFYNGWIVTLFCWSFLLHNCKN